MNEAIYKEKINGKTQEQIRAGLIICTNESGGCGRYKCPYEDDGDCSGSLMKDSLMLIERYESYLVRQNNLLNALGVSIPDAPDQPDGWARVEDILPKPFVSVQVYMPGEAPHPTVREGFLTDKGVWHAGLYDREPGEVTHWREMSKPPREDT